MRVFPTPVVNPSMLEPQAQLNTRLQRLAVVALLLVAFALRVHHLDFQSLESDEGISLQRSSQPLGQMLELMPVEHVPGYFVLLNGWLRVSGESDFALRFLSVLPSVLAVALIYRWGASMGRPWAGIIAAVLLATNSFQLWYAQQARMYSWLLMSSLFSCLALWYMVRPKVIQKQTSSRLVDLVYILSTTVTVYLHYFGFLVPVVQTIFMGLWVAWRSDRTAWGVVRRWAINGLIILALFVPWLPKTLEFLSFQGWREPLDPYQVPWMMHRAYTVGFPMPEPWLTWLPWLYLALMVVGLWVWWRQDGKAGLLLAVATLVPLALIFVAVLRNPDYHERYSMFLAAPWLLLVAGGLSVLWPSAKAVKDAQNARNGVSVFSPVLLASVLMVIVLAGLVMANGVAIQRLYTDTSLHKPDYHGAAYRIIANELAGDVVLVDGPNPELVFNHYYYDTYHGSAVVHDLRPIADESYEEIDAALQEDTAGADRAWEVLYFRSPAAVQMWLATNGWSTAPTYHNGIRVVLYGLDRGPLVEQVLVLPVGDGLTLQVAGVEGPTVTPGDLLRVTTHWRVDAPLPDYKFSLRLLTPDGNSVIADDYVPQNWFAPTAQWSVGQVVDQRALLLPNDLPVGDYVVTLRLYDPMNGIPIETELGQDIPLGRVQVR